MPKVRRKEKIELRVESLVEGVRERIAALAGSGDPILAGPFTGEVGFELLYWIPFLRWIVDEFPESGNRLVVISRGGTEHWLAGMGARYVDIFSLYPPDEFVRRRPSLKQTETTGFEEEIYETVRRRLGIDHAEVLHPEVFFRLYYLLRKVDRYAFVRSVRRTPTGAKGLLAVYEPLPAPEPAPIAAELPEEYVAARFYFRPSFPDTTENREFASLVLRSIARRTPVVLLNNRLELDEHVDFSDERLEGSVTTIDGAMTPEDNLQVQTAILSRARAFVGTYGGLAYLAPFLGVSSVSFSSLPEHTHHFHLDLARNIFEGPSWGSIFMLRPDELPLLSLVCRGSVAERDVIASQPNS
jgi:hypothetical protein